MALMTWDYDGTRVIEAGSTTDYSLFTGLSYSGLPENIKIKRCYWQWTVSRSSGSVYARWYEQGNSSNKGSAGVNGTFTFDVALVTATSGNPKVYLGSQYGKSTYSNISFNIEFDYLQSSFTLSTTNVDAGKTITANIAIQDSTATHKATWQFGTKIEQTTSGSGETANSFTIPLAWLDQIPNATSGLASCKLETINSAGDTVGSQTLNFNIAAPASVVPSITSLTATRVNNNVPSAWGVYVQGQSGVTVKATASGAYGSTITGYTLAGDGKTANAATLSIAKLSGSGTLTFKATVVDSRGRSASKTLTISVVAWSSPTIRTLSVGRCNADRSDNPAGSSILVTLDGSISAVGGNNAPTVTVGYRERGTLTWLSGATGAVASGSWVIAQDDALPTSAYEVRVTIADEFAEATQTTILSTADCYLDQMPGRRRLGVGAYCPTDNTLYIDPEMTIKYGETTITGKWDSLAGRPGNMVRYQWLANAATYANGATITFGQDPTKYAAIFARLDWGGVAVGTPSGNAGSRGFVLEAASSSSNVKLNVVVLSETADPLVWKITGMYRIMGSGSSVTFPALSSLNIGQIFGLEVMS